jgi:hypothetical protein
MSRRHDRPRARGSRTMKLRNETGEPPRRRRGVASALDETLFEAWVAGPERAREAAWLRLWTAAHQMAMEHCHRLAPTEDAEGQATRALAEAWLEIERDASMRQIDWRTRERFLRWVRTRVIGRCDGLRRVSPRTRTRAVRTRGAIASSDRAVRRVRGIVGMVPVPENITWTELSARIASWGSAILTGSARSPVSNEPFDALLDRMQTRAARRGMRAAFNASPGRLGAAAVALARRRG